MKINEVEQLIGVPKKTIRFYEEQGLIAPERNRENGYRVYGEDHVEALKRIKLLRKLSIPIEDIRQMQQGIITVDDAMKRQIIVLKRESENLRERADMCAYILDQEETVLAQMSPDHYLDKIKSMEQKGVNFMKTEQKISKKEYVAPVLAAALMGALMIAMIGLFYWAYRYDDMPFMFMAVCCIVVAVIVLGILTALLQRIREIGGEEYYDTRKY